MRISDWSSDVCSSDLRQGDQRRAGAEAALAEAHNDHSGKSHGVEPWIGNHGEMRQHGGTKPDRRQTAGSVDGMVWRSLSSISSLLCNTNHQNEAWITASDRKSTRLNSSH